MLKFSEYLRDEYRIHDLSYDLVWQAARPIKGEFKTRLLENLEEECNRHGYKLDKVIVDNKKVYLTLRIWPSQNIQVVNKQLKTMIARRLRTEIQLPQVWKTNVQIVPVGSDTDNQFNVDYALLQRRDG